MPVMYKIISNISKDKLTHVVLHKVDPIFFKIMDTDVKIKIGTKLEDKVKNTFRVNGYFGVYVVLRSERFGTHPVGTFLIET